MTFHETKIAGVFEIHLDRADDERGFFARSWCQREFESHGLNSKLVQCNVSFNQRKGTLRGMHYQAKPFPEAKLVRCTQGAIYDVVVDLRPESQTFKHWIGVDSTRCKPHMIYMPEGCGHGFLTLDNQTEIFYQMSEFYHPELSRGVRFNDPAFKSTGPSAGGDFRPRSNLSRFRMRPQDEPAARIRSGDLAKAGREIASVSPRSSIPFAVASPVTASGRRWHRFRSEFRCRPLRFLRGLQFSTGRFRKSGTSATRISKIPTGKRVVDFQKNNLHVLNYSTPVRATMPLSELKPHLFTIPDRPDWIPYRTSYYQENWGFCLPHSRLLAMPDDDYEVCIDSTLEAGHLTYAECFLPGRSSEEVLISCHACHPSLANDNLSGLVVATYLAELLSGIELEYSYRFVFIPGTIGAITWLARNQENTRHIRHGLVLTGIGDRAGFHYKKSRRSDADIDRAVAHVLRHCEESFEVLEFSPYGYDERQYCSPGFNLPVGCLMRSVWGTFPEYHTSADNLDFIEPLQLARSLRLCAGVLNVLENNRTFRNLNPYCEPQLGKRISTGRRVARRSEKRSMPASGCSTCPTASTRCSISPSAPGCHFRDSGCRRASIAMRTAGRIDTTVSSLRSVSSKVAITIQAPSAREGHAQRFAHVQYAPLRELR